MTPAELNATKDKATGDPTVDVLDAAAEQRCQETMHASIYEAGAKPDNLMTLLTGKPAQTVRQAGPLEDPSTDAERLKSAIVDGAQAGKTMTAGVGLNDNGANATADTEGHMMADQRL